MDIGKEGGPLAGLRVIEFASIGPGPHCASLLADLGAEVLRIDRPGGNGWPNAVVDRGRFVCPVDIRTDAGRDLCLAAADNADVVLEGFRPGVMERRGLGPADMLARNAKLVYGRMTGWGQTGPLAHSAGHDINYVALAGALASFGPPGTPPPPPLNLVGDFGGGSLYLAFGILAALYERDRSGAGQVVDAAILDGVASMMGMFAGMADSGRSFRDRDTSMLGGGAPFYRCYECADGRYISVGAIEPQFYAELIERIGAPQEFLASQHDKSLWPERSRRIEEIFRSQRQQDWCALLEGTDACFAPVLTLEEASGHPQMVARETYAIRHGHPHHRPAPRFSRSRADLHEGGNGAELMARWAVDPDRLAAVGGALCAFEATQ